MMQLSNEDVQLNRKRVLEALRTHPPHLQFHSKLVDDSGTMTCALGTMAMELGFSARELRSYGTAIVADRLYLLLDVMVNQVSWWNDAHELTEKKIADNLEEAWKTS